MVVSPADHPAGLRQASAVVLDVRPRWEDPVWQNFSRQFVGWVEMGNGFQG
jgi:hypothetical protein